MRAMIDWLFGLARVETPCASTYEQGRIMAGTLLTVRKKSNNVGYKFSIRTPGTPMRWAQYEEELDHWWTTLTQQMRGKTPADPRRCAPLEACVPPRLLPSTRDVSLGGKGAGSR